MRATREAASKASAAAAGSARRRYSGGGEARRNLNFGPKEHGCGIAPWNPPVPPPVPPRVEPLPERLIRPPCYPGQPRGQVQTCVSGEEGVYCVPCRLKYKYPPFSENIDFVPQDVHPNCWWRSSESCLYTDDRDEAVKAMTKSQPCPYDNRR